MSMSVSWQQQGFALLLALCIGMALGFVYDLLRPARRHKAGLAEYALDLLYWIVVTLVVFLCAPILGRGFVRVYMLSAHLLGAVLYFRLLSRGIRGIMDFVDGLILRLSELICRPFVQISTALTARLATYFSCIGKTAKNIFSFGRKWFTIKRTSKKSEHVPETGSSSEEGRAHAENKKGWSCD